jgi:cytochrome c oxidase subunit 2
MTKRGRGQGTLSPNRRRWFQTATAAVTVAGSAILLSACSKSPSALDPQGPEANEINTLWWILLAIGALVWFIVMGLMLYAVFRRRRAAPDPNRELAEPQKLVLIGGAVIPAIILIGLLFVITNTIRETNKTGSSSDLTIEIIGHQWWWEVHYPKQAMVQQDFTTANELHIPVGQKVQLKLSSADVIHSFWVPQIQGKMDLIPGQTNTLWVESDNPGDFRGQCAEYCGVQHAHMALHVIADPPDKLNAWLTEQAKPAQAPADAQALNGQQLFLGSACVYCHAVKGTNASGQIGPDLTHLASRGFIGASTLENNTANLKAWITNPQDSKPGNLMPPTQMDQSSLDALVAYLESLR